MSSEAFLESFLVSDEEMSRASTPAQLTRTSNESYVMLNEKYMIRRGKKEPMQQYGSLYLKRLEKLKKVLSQKARVLWCNQIADASKKPRIVENILDIVPQETTIIIGTFFKEQGLKPTILDNIMGIISKSDFEYGAFVTPQDSTQTATDEKQEKGGKVADSGVLEDRSGRITIQDSDKFKIDQFVSGTILALKGKAIDGGYFEVEEYCVAGIPYNSRIPSQCQLSKGAARSLYDHKVMQSADQRQFVAFVSGLRFGMSSKRDTEYILKFLSGELGSLVQIGGKTLDTRVLPAQIQRLVIAGDSTVQPDKVDEVLRGSYRTSKLNSEVYSSITGAVSAFDEFLDRASQLIDVDVMPGEQDFSNSFLPQQPFNTCLFPVIAKNQRSSVNLVTNPHQFKFNGLTFLGSAGQNIKDILMNTVGQNKEPADEGQVELKTAIHTLEVRHLCPSAPDTLRVHPFKESDPFVIAESDLCLDGDEDMADETTQGAQANQDKLNTSVPHVYFIGNMPAYKEQLLTQGKASGKDSEFIKVITVPVFEHKKSIVLLDTETLDSYEVTFDVTPEADDEEKTMMQVDG